PLSHSLAVSRMIRLLPRATLYSSLALFVFFFNDTATTEIYTLSLHDALPISHTHTQGVVKTGLTNTLTHTHTRSEEHTSELQSHLNLVCRLLLENNNKPHLATTHPPTTHPSTHSSTTCTSQ